MSTTDPRSSARSVPPVDEGALLAVERIGPQCRIVIKRIHKHNALSRETLAALRSAIEKAAVDTTVTYVVIRGDGERYFAAGGDLIDLSTVRTELETAEFATTSRAALDAVRNCPLPVIAFVNGDALGGGAELAMACDLRVMNSSARIGYVQSRLAITAAWGGAADLCAAVGAARAMQMMMRAEMIGAKEALEIRLCEAVVDGDLDGADAQAFFAPIDRVPRHVLAATKENVVACRTAATYQAAREIEQRNLIATWTDGAHWAAVDRFLSRTRSDAADPASRDSTPQAK
jgi:enoyl-CoA hydratase